MDLKLITPQDIDQIINLWQTCFNDSKEFVDFFFSSRFEPENTLGIFDGDRIISCLQLLPYKLFLRGRTVDAYYIVGVCTMPQYRNKGYVKYLLHHSISHMNEKGAPVSILLPFQYEFYRKYGWEICYDIFKYTNMSDLNNDKKYNQEDFHKIELNRDFEFLDKCYKYFMEKYSGFVYRSINDWKRIYYDYHLDGGSGYLYIKNGEPLGYFMYIRENKSFLIKELIYTNPHAKWDMLAFANDLAGKSSENMCLITPSDDLTYLRMADPRGKIQKEAYVMGRINNVINGLKGIPVKSSGSLSLKVIDLFYSENNSVYYLDASSDQLEITNSVRKDAYDITLSINTLSQLLWGYISPVKAYEQGLLKVNNMDSLEVLNDIFSCELPYIIEDY